MATERAEEGLEAEVAEVDIIQMVKAVESEIIIQIKKMELTAASQLAGMNKMN